MRFLVLIPIVYAAAVLETSLVDVLRIGNVTPDLLALTAIVWLLFANGPRAFLAAGAIALVGDPIAPGRLGVGMGWMLLVGYGVSQLRARVKCDHLVGQLTVTWAAVTIWATGVGLTGRLLGEVAMPASTILARAVGVGCYTAGVALPLLLAIGWIGEPLLPRKRRPAPF